MGINKRFIAKNGLDNNNQTIANVADPVNAQDVATKNFASNASNLTTGTIPDTRIPSSFVKTDVNGNVGIGTASPTAKLDVAGNIAITGTGGRITGDFSNATQSNRLLFQSNVLNGVTNVGLIPNGTSTTCLLTAFSTSDASNSSTIQLTVDSSTSSINSNITGTGTYKPLTFITGGSERMRIDTAGNVGIGISTGGSKLNVLGNLELRGPQTGTATSAVAFLKGADGVQAGYWGYGTIASPMEYVNDRATGHAWYDNGSERMRIDTAGKVGIGTASPSQKLHVYNASGNTSALIHTASANNASVYLLNSLKQYHIANNASGALDFYDATANKSRVVITSVGNVGIGTTNPQDALHVAGGANAKVISEGSNGYGAFHAVSSGTTPAYMFFSNATSGDINRITANNDGTLQFGAGAAATEQMRISPTGDVSTGVGAPTAAAAGRRVTVNNLETTSPWSNAGVTLVTKNIAGTANSIFDIMKNKNGTAYLHNSEPGANANFIFAINSTEKLYITSNGSVLAVNSNGGIGYGGGSGGTVAQATNKSTAVTLNKPNGVIQMTAETMASGAVAGFNFYNNTIGANDHMLVTIGPNVNPMTYNVWATAASDGLAYVYIKNISASTLAEAVQIRFAVIKGSVA